MEEIIEEHSEMRTYKNSCTNQYGNGKDDIIMKKVYLNFKYGWEHSSITYYIILIECSEWSDGSVLH